MKKIAIFLFIVVTLGIWVGIKKSNSASALEVNAAVVSVRNIESSILASGNVIYDREVKIRSEVTGRVSEVLVEEGQLVRKGDVLAKLDDTSFVARVEQMKSDINLLRIELSRAKEEHIRAQQQLKRIKILLAKGLTSEDSVEELQTFTNLARLQVERAKASLVGGEALLQESLQELAKTTFVAPMDGLVVSLSIKVGETVVAGTTNIIGSELMLVAAPSSMKVNLRVDEADVANVKLGQLVNIYAAADQDKKILGTVSKIGVRAATANSTSNSGLVVMIKVDLDGNTQHLRSGMSCRAEIVNQQIDTAVVVPVSALSRQNNEDNYLWIVEEGKAKRLSVELGLATDTEQQILAGVSEGQQVITGPSRKTALLRDGIAVRVIETPNQGS
ncbi:efflux RND transporter periplasmic adaptor subunit [Thalassotalea sp. 1_MG-2023]|uniref:efflux RND transporter periplasmic adaptor subunit n=1 Tax=Thalassotalea sp. 1_MG-2023 TaxID=3062680 RepID=UPI0026E25B21|nr:efflux RND transporter periplasmic adaptor subunit [Thalassotalea sp. 1_MG-2023]MDO6428511.1 efflux RND transporter periplasmic adaptor subunit [Thalassotalea sp. 1_MG-2023]